MTSAPIVVRQLHSPTEDEVNRIMTVLGAAFNGDQFSSFLTAGSPELGGLISRSQIAAAAIGGQIYVAGYGPDEILGVAVWFGPDQELFSSEEQRNAGFTEFIQKANPELQKWWMEYFLPTYSKFTTESLGEGYKLKCWQLQLIATKPENQRQGIARALIETVEKLARVDNAPLSLETETDIDVIIYRTLGFEVRGTTLIKSSLGECNMYCMTKNVV